MDQELEEKEFETKITTTVICLAFVVGLHHAYIRRLRKNNKIMLNAMKLIIEEMVANEQREFDRSFTDITRNYNI